LTLGRKLWWEKIQAKEVEKGKQEESEEDDEPVREELDWTPERVQRWLQGVLSMGALWIRRGRWFCLLAESSIAWKADSSDHGYLMLSLESGCVKSRQHLSPNGVARVPKGYRKSPLERRSVFNRATYDRLAVLTSELRRLLAEERCFQVRLSPTRVLGKEHLNRILFWI
jgi:hypothetical protein